MVATKRCAWANVKMTLDTLLKRNKNNDPVKFYHFPVAVRGAERQRTWIIACHGGDNFVCTKDSYVCGLHIVGSNGPRKENPDPISAMASNEKVKFLHSQKLNCTENCC